MSVFTEKFADDIDLLESALRVQFRAAAQAQATTRDTMALLEASTDENLTLLNEMSKHRGAVADMLETSARSTVRERGAKTELQQAAALYAELQKQQQDSRRREEHLSSVVRQAHVTNDAQQHEIVNLKAALAALREQARTAATSAEKSATVEAELKRVQQESQRSQAELERKLQDALMQIAALPALTQQRDILRQQLATAEAKNHQLAAQLAALAAAAGAQPTLATGSAAGDGAAKKATKTAPSTRKPATSAADALAVRDVPHARSKKSALATTESARERLYTFE